MKQQCEFCNYVTDRSAKFYMVVKVYTRINRNFVLCERCIDKVNLYMSRQYLNTYWTDQFCVDRDIPKFPAKKLKIFNDFRAKKDDKHDSFNRVKALRSVGLF